MGESRRFQLALVASAAIHAAVLLGLARMVQIPVRPVRIIPVSLVGAPGGGGGAAGNGASAAPAPEPAPAEAPSPAPPRPEIARKAPPRRVARAAAPPAVEHPRASAAAASPGGAAGGTGDAGSGAGGSGGMGGGGDGTGGDGSGGTHAAYASNPRPTYPPIAVRLGIEGVVLLDVLVAPDGRATDVRVAHSSGFAPLDESAVKTVRERWRFVPASRGGTPIESRVTVPIRFRLDEDRG